MRISVLLPGFVEDYISRKAVVDAACKYAIHEESLLKLDFSPSDSIVSLNDLTPATAKNLYVKACEDGSDYFLVFCDDAYALFVAELHKGNICESAQTPIVPVLVGSDFSCKEEHDRYKFWHSIDSELIFLFNYLVESNYRGKKCLLCRYNSEYARSVLRRIDQVLIEESRMFDKDEVLIWDESGDLKNELSEEVKFEDCFVANEIDTVFLIGHGDETHKKMFELIFNSDFNGTIFANSAVAGLLKESKIKLPANGRCEVCYVDVKHKDGNGSLQEKIVNLLFRLIMGAYEEDRNVKIQEYAQQLRTVFDPNLGVVTFGDDGEIEFPLVLKRQRGGMWTPKSIASERMSAYRMAAFQQKMDDLFFVSTNYIKPKDAIEGISHFFANLSLELTGSNGRMSCWVSSENDIGHLHSTDEVPYELCESIYDFARSFAFSNTTHEILSVPIQVNLKCDDILNNGAARFLIGKGYDRYISPAMLRIGHSIKSLFKDSAINYYAQFRKAGVLVSEKLCIDNRGKEAFCKLLELCKQRFLYIFFSGMSSIRLSIVCVVSDVRFDFTNLRALKNQADRVLMFYNGHQFTQAILIKSIKSAIGSIMSRNGSHNIGSHVLAALSHNVGTMPDDRVLYQYIQHRMDYIATATTDFPVWKQPLYLVGNLMKTFLMQRHLLDHITGSEGLRAYQFQNDRIDTIKDGCQPNTIRIHIRRINDADSEWGEANNFSTNQPTINFIGYPDSPPNPGAMRHDLELAIPGGIVGQHAFFTILENILRNAAKHEWAKLKNVQNDGNVVSCGESTNGKSSDGQSDSDSSNREKGPYHHLDIHIDFKDNPDAGIVEFVVWTDSEYSRQNYKVGTFKNRAVRLTREDVLSRLSQDDSTGDLDTKGLEAHQKLQLMMARSLINNEGQLRKENWGLAEMRISAGFLNVVDIATIGGLGDRTATMDLISPTMVLYKDHYCMGYHFHVPKPRELLIVVPDDLLKNKKNAIQKTDLESAHAKLMKYGVGIVTEDEVGKESEKLERSDRLSYAYALFNKFNRDCMRTWKIPFRLVTIANDPLSPPLSPKKDKGQKPIDRRADFTGNADFFAPNSFSAWLRDVLKSDDKAKEHAEKILSEIYASWVRHLKKECFGVGNGLKNIPIAIDLDGDNKNAEGSLISDMELLELVLGDCFNSAVDSYLTSPLSEKADDSLKHTLKLLKTLHPRIIELQRLKTKTLIDTEKNKEIKVARDVDGVIRAQLLTWCIALEEDANVRKIASDLYYIEEGRNQTCTPGLKGFMLFLTNTILNQVKALMTRYEERFVPLPRDILPPKHQTSQRSENRDPNSQHGGNGYLEPLIDLGNQQVFETVSDEVKCNFLEEHMNASNDTAEILAFWRHEVSASPRTIERGKKEIKLRYREPLSGSQSYLNSFETFYDGSSTEIQRKRFVAKLLETGLTKVLLIDERVKRFENEHSNVKATFADIGISTLDNECCETKELFNFAQQKRHPIDVKIDDQLISEFDIVVIHQGVIDKLLADHNNPDKIRKFIEYLKSEIRYVVVTTGRGNPANIPNDVRVLPFSVIESTLFKKYPEKLIFIDAIMNLLPSGGKE